MRIKKIALICILSLLALALTACSLLPSQTPTPTPKPQNDPKPVLRGDSVVIFGSNNAFTLVYGEDDVSVGGSFAGKVVNEVSALGLKTPEFAVDNEKTETKCELLVGDTNRALSAEAKAIIDEKAAEDPRGDHWIFLYRDGQLAVYANGNDAYELALAELTEKYYKAGEITVKKDIKSIGYVAGPHDAYMEYEVFDNFYDGYTDPFGMDKKDYKEMVVTRSDDAKISIDYYLDSKTYYRVNFVRKQWGMWMLGAIAYVDKGTAHQLCPGSTDYEFVLSCGNETTPTFRSGNHANFGKADQYDPNDSTTANDRLLDMTLYDAKSGERIDIDKVGTKVTVDGLRIVMHHNIYEQEYAQENVLVNVEKSYLFNGFDILFDSKLYMTQDVKFHNSYSCMFPIMKEYGNCMMLYNMDGTTTYAVTSPVALGGREYDLTLWNHKTTKVELWGEKHPEYHMTVEIHNPDDQFYGSTSKKSYVGLRDMLGGSQNKVYFTVGASHPTLNHGTELHFVNSWTFSYHEGFENLDREPDVTVIKSK